MKISKFAIMFGILICLGSVSLMAQEVRVGGSSLSANGHVVQGHQYTGSCPVDLKFDWGLMSTGRTEVVYRFESSDGSHSTHSQRVMIPQAHHNVPVYKDWRLGKRSHEYDDYHGWVNLIIESPNPVEKKIEFTIHCQ